MLYTALAIRTIQILRTRNGVFIVDDNNRKALSLVCEHFTKPQPETKRKGIALVGEVGVGKSEILFGFFKAIHDLSTIPEYEYFKQHRYSFKTCRDTAQSYQKHGFDGIGFYTKQYTSTTPPRLNNMAFDDLGTERNQKFYGNEANVMSEIIQERYDRFKSGLVTHFTTNLTPEQINEYYGDRATDRLNEMCKFIQVGGGSRRA